MKTHYIYKITNTTPTDERKYYIGVHSDDNSDSLNDGYMGSSKYLDEAMKDIGVERFNKEILSTWDTRAEASAEEIRLHQSIDVAGSADYYNKHNACEEGFNTLGRVAAINIKTMLVEHVSKEELKMNKTLSPITKGKIAVIDLRDNTTKQVSTIDYNNYDYYKSVTCGKVAVIDLRDNSNKLINKSDFDTNDHFVALNYKKPVAVIDLRDNTKQLVSKDCYNRFDYYVSTSSKIIDIFDEYNNLIYTCQSEFSKFCKLNNLPHDSFMQSYKHSKKLYINASNNIISRLKKNGNIKYMGWSASVREII